MGVRPKAILQSMYMAVIVGLCEREGERFPSFPPLALSEEAPTHPNLEQGVQARGRGRTTAEFVLDGL